MPRTSVLSAALTLALSAQAPADRIHLRFDPSEAEAALAILELHGAGRPVPEAAWSRLFATEPYVRLKAREAGLKRAFTDEEFKAFLLAPDLAARAPELRRTLEAWKRSPLAARAVSILPYLPAAATVQAKVFPVIKPKTNSFVFEVTRDPTVFLYLDPAVSAGEFENTVAHELHHVGFASLSNRVEERLQALPEPARRAAEWTGAFGEGFAMLAAAGGPDIHPHAASPPATRARWDRDVARHNEHLRDVERFLLDVVRGRLKTAEEINTVAYTFFGEQGPWYTVGHRMAVLVERHQGRAALLACLEDPRRILAAYNRAAEAEGRKGGERLARWSDELIQALGPETTPPAP
jgi:hypothetical protein